MQIVTKFGINAKERVQSKNLFLDTVCLGGSQITKKLKILNTLQW